MLKYRYKAHEERHCFGTSNRKFCAVLDTLIIVVIVTYVLMKNERFRRHCFLPYEIRH